MSSGRTGDVGESYVLIAQWTTLHSRHCARHKACALLFLLTAVLRSALAPAKGGEKRGSLKGLQRVTGSSDTRVRGIGFQTLGVLAFSARPGCGNKKCSHLHSVSPTSRPGRVLMVDFRVRELGSDIRDIKKVAGSLFCIRRSSLRNPGGLFDLCFLVPEEVEGLRCRETLLLSA